MVCYARPASRLAAILLVAWLVFAVPVSHFFDTAALVMAVTVATSGAAVAAALAFATFMSVRRRRGAAGGCVSCQFRCQHAMTGPGRRLWLVTTADRRPPEPAHPGAPGHRSTAPARSVPMSLPMPAVRSAAGDPTAPRWPDRPAYRDTQVSRRAHRAAHVRARGRAGSPALARPARIPST
jgi:hypothetical protein